MTRPQLSPSVSALGTVYWITGLSGSGKTTIARLFANAVQSRGGRPILLDGDELRDVLGQSFGYTSEERLRLAMVYCRLCRSLASQGFDVIIATVAMFSAIRDWNRNNLGSYREIYLRVPIQVLIQRDPKEIYSRAQRGEISNVVGIDVPIDEPRTPDLIIDNFGSCTPERAVDRILSEVWNADGRHV